jgi:hypothetical protein
MQQKHQASGPGGWTNHHINPLDATDQKTDEKAFNFMYFIKVVSTAYLPLGWEKESSDNVPYGDMMGATIGDHHKGSIETHQYSVTSHKRSLAGGNDEEAGHKERIHARGGIPGVFFSYVGLPFHSLTSFCTVPSLLGSLFLSPFSSRFYLHFSISVHAWTLWMELMADNNQDISPMKVINREVRAKTFSGFLVGLCAVIGGTLTVAAAVDRALYEGVNRVKKMHSN